MKSSDETGRSMIEMLGVLGVMGLLSIAGIIGYRRALDANQTNALLFSAQQYATLIYLGKKANPTGFGIPDLPTATELGLNPLEIGLYPTDDYLKDNGVELHLSFYKETHCQIAARLLGERCALVSKGATCRDVEKSGLPPLELAKVIGCFNHIFIPQK